MVERLDVTLDELQKLRHRIDKDQLESSDLVIFGALVSTLIERAEQKQERMLQKLAVDAAEKGAHAPGEVMDAAHDGESSESAFSSDENAKSTDGTVDNIDPKNKKGHGRNGANAYANAKHIFHALTVGILGALCAACGVGRMSRYREKIVVRIVGQPLFFAEIHHYEQVRCKICGQIIRAAGPAFVLHGIGTGYVTYDWSACAMLIVMHYFGGAPFKRLESLHESWGVPLADANQWNLVDRSDELLLPLHKAIELYGIQKATTLRIDDTGSKVITLMREIQAEIAACMLLGKSTRDVRTGINATGVYLETPDETIILFYTGRHHAGEIIDQLLRHRRHKSPKLVKVTDGASKNFDHQHEDKLLEATCNAHAFLKFRDIKDKYPAEYAIAGEVYKKVFDNDDVTKNRKMTPMKRMYFHQMHSKPLMQKLRGMCEEKIKSKLVEPHSPLWEPLTFVINQWSRLTKFCEEPGVPLDTNLVEQTLIIPVRYLAGSFNYKTVNGAEVGDRHMSLIATARANRVEPVAYLTDCLRHHEDLARRPEHYLPWVYRERLKKRDIHADPVQQAIPIEYQASRARTVHLSSEKITQAM